VQFEICRVSSGLPSLHDILKDFQALDFALNMCEPTRDSFVEPTAKAHHDTQQRAKGSKESSIYKLQQSVRRERMRDERSKRNEGTGNIAMQYVECKRPTRWRGGKAEAKQEEEACKGKRCAMTRSSRVTDDRVEGDVVVLGDVAVVERDPDVEGTGAEAGRLDMVVVWGRRRYKTRDVRIATFGRLRRWTADVRNGRRDKQFNRGMSV
jgi:hypothetical protein